MIAPWPNGHTWALVLTHDVEHAEGLAAIGPVLSSNARLVCALVEHRPEPI